MKKTSLIKTFSILAISMVVILISTGVFAADNSDYTDLTATLQNGGSSSSSSSKSSSSSSSSTSSSSTSKSNTNTNTNTNSNSNTNKTNTNTNTSNTASTSVYNNTNANLPKTGAESSIPVAMLVVILGVSAVYAYKKVNDYRNI